MSLCVLTGIFVSLVCEDTDLYFLPENRVEEFLGNTIYGEVIENHNLSA